MISQKSYRRKQEYEDLDEICNAKNETFNNYGQESGFCHVRHHPNMFSSDTAIHMAPEKIHSKKLTKQISTTNSLVTGSIPCLFRLSTNFPIVMIDNGNESDKKTSDQQTNKLLRLKGKQNFYLLCFVLFYAFYLAFGAFCFKIIEEPEERRKLVNFNTLRSDFLTKYPEVAENDLNDILKATISASNNGFKITTNSTNEVDWNFGDLILFTTSIITTIGYGHLAPMTNGGKLFCIIYATIGIPLTLILLSTMVEHLLKLSNKFLIFLLTKLGDLYQIVSIRILHLSIMAFAFLILFLIIPAVIFAHIELNWSILDSFYYCFTSLTTIGLGDLVPDEAHSSELGNLYKIMTSIYLILGLIAIMLVLTIFYTIPQLNIGPWLVETTDGQQIDSLTTQITSKKNSVKINSKEIPQIRIQSNTSSSSSSGTVKTII